jgi:hypothetical protein
MDAAKQWAPQAKTYGDFRKLLEDREIDAVIIATPDPWHASMLILACEAGKDVYLEKPVIYRINEDEPTSLHTKYFMDSVRARKKPFANIETGVRATLISCIGNVAYWTGRKLRWDAEAFRFTGDEDANKYLSRPYRKPWDLVKL